MRTTATVHLANNYIRVHGFHEEFRNRVIMPFVRRYLYKTARELIPGSREKRWVVTHAFARFNHDKSELRICRELFDDFIGFATQSGYAEKRIAIKEEVELFGEPVQFEFQDGWGQPREHQVEWLEYQLLPGALKINNMTPGGGKETSLDCLIKIPGGWKRMGDIQVGDIVTAADGTPTNVLGVFPQGVKDVYRFHFADGRTVDCGLEHLWKIHFRGFPDVVDKKSYRKSTNTNNQFKILPTKDILHLMENVKEARNRLYIPLCESEIIADAEYPIDPYVMGCLLGDGSYSAESVTISKPYQQLFDKVQSRLPDHLECSWYRNGDDTPKTFGIRFKDSYTRSSPDHHNLKKHLKDFGMMGTRCWEKVIPEEYLHGSTRQRLDLLRGLLDTDGTCGVNSRVSYSTTSKVLAEQVQYLVRSLGGIAKLSIRNTQYAYQGEKKEGREAYSVYIRYPRPEELFTLDHKSERAVTNQYSETLKLKIVSIEKLPAVEQQCIMIEHPDHLYVTDDFVVTHNTFCALYQMIKMGVRTIITIQPRYITTWIKALGNIVKLDPRDVILCDGDLDAIATSVENGTINPKVIILPMTQIVIHLKKEKEDPSIPDLGNIFERLKCGYRIQDEAHEAIHQIYLSMMFGNFKKTLVLSGTLDADDAYTNKIYNWLFPKKYYLKATEYKKYLDIIAYQYQIDVRKYKINTQSVGGYSDDKFEKSIIRHSKTLTFYFDLVRKAFEEYYIPRRREGSKCLFFFSKVEMCERMCAMLKHFYPDLDIIAFTGENSKKADQKYEYLKHEIVIATPGSCGTGKDIPGLINVFCWHTVSSKQRNDQILMRLREIHDLYPDIDPIFLYGVCMDLQKHKDYHIKRHGLFASKAKRQRLINSDMILL